ncbi:MAG: flagellar hook-length control protein FliK [Endozoicomonas sp.]
MIPAAFQGVIAGQVDGKLSGIAENIESRLTDGESADFDGLIQQFIGSENLDVSDERLQALRSTLEDMDDSEVLGFLAMLENQSAWNPENQQPSGNPLAQAMSENELEFQGFYRPVNVAPEFSARPEFEDAVRQAMHKASENFMPTAEPGQKRESGQQGTVVEMPDKLADADFDATRKLAAGTVSLPEELVEQKVVPIKAGVTDSMLGRSLAALSSQVSPAAVAAEAISGSVDEMPASAAKIAELQTRVDSAQAPQTAASVRPDVMADKGSWSDLMGQRLLAMVSQGRQEASIRLDPPELGTLGVRLVVQDSGVSVQFVSDVPQVREMLETQSDRLRIALEQQGMNLVDVNVGQDSSNQDQQQFASADGAIAGQSSFDSTEMEVMELSLPEPSSTLSQGFINTFA